MAQDPIIIVKFRQMASQLKRHEKFVELLGEELEAADPLFPDTEEPGLGSIFQLKLRTENKAKDILDLLSADKEIEYVHQPSKRRPKESQ